MNKAMKISIIGVLMLGCIMVSRYLFSQDTKDFSGVMFSIEIGRLKFFDQHSGKVYDYSADTGKLLRIWTLHELGEDMTEYNSRRAR